jgi:hypothetical protein
MSPSIHAAVGRVCTEASEEILQLCEDRALAETTPDTAHPGFSQYQWWKDQKKREIDGNKQRLLLHNSVKTRCDRIRAQLPAELQLNPKARGIKDNRLAPSPTVLQATSPYR